MGCSHASLGSLRKRRRISLYASITGTTRSIEAESKETSPSSGRRWFFDFTGTSITGLDVRRRARTQRSLSRAAG